MNGRKIETEREEYMEIKKLNCCYSVYQFITSNTMMERITAAFKFYVQIDRDEEIYVFLFATNSNSIDRSKQNT